MVRPPSTFELGEKDVFISRIRWGLPKLETVEESLAESFRLTRPFDLAQILEEGGSLLSVNEHVLLIRAIQIAFESPG